MSEDSITTFHIHDNVVSMCDSKLGILISTVIEPEGFAFWYVYQRAPKDIKIKLLDILNKIN